jgi:hypothetical protein
MGEKGLGLDLRKSPQQQLTETRLEKNSSLWVSYGDSQPFPLSTSEDTPVDDRFGFIWVDKEHGFAILVLASCAEAGSHQHTQRRSFSCVAFFYFDD